MGKNIVEKIFADHLAYGELKQGSPVGLRVDEVYTQDATGTMTWLQFEAMCIDRVRVPLAVSYVDHNMIQSNFMNPDDHLFLQTAAAKFGAWFSKPGNGICHQVNLERFAGPGWIGLGTDSHTPTNGGMGMIAIGVGGLDAATVMAGNPFEISMPMVVRVELKGTLQRPYVSAMDIILELLRRLTVKGGVGKIFEYGGEGSADLNVMERATITNMGAELGATTSVFPSDEKTRAFLKAQGREANWKELRADEDAVYAETIEIDLHALDPMIAQPHSPDAVTPLKELAGTTVHQVCIGSCTNSSYQAMRTVASVLKRRMVKDSVNLHINPGSKQVYEMIGRDGGLADMLRAGARMLEASCGPCIGMGGAPATGQVSVRTYNRNFKGRSGNKDAFTYLASPVSAVIMAVRGEMIDPRESGITIEDFEDPMEYPIDDNLMIPPVADTAALEIIKGPNIKEVPVKEPTNEEIRAEVLLKLGDNITTDDIMPAGSAVLPFRSNIPAISEFVFYHVDESFSKRAAAAKQKGGGIIVGADNYGQGSSREHAALAPMYLGIHAVISKSFARIHRSNLINFGILPLIFEDSADYGKVQQGDVLHVRDVKKGLLGTQKYRVDDKGGKYSFTVISNLNDREKDIITSGGLLSYARKMCALHD